MKNQRILVFFVFLLTVSLFYFVQAHGQGGKGTTAQKYLSEKKITLVNPLVVDVSKWEKTQNDIKIDVDFSTQSFDDAIAKHDNGVGGELSQCYQKLQRKYGAMYGGFFTAKGGMLVWRGTIPQSFTIRCGDKFLSLKMNTETIDLAEFQQKEMGAIILKELKGLFTVPAAHAEGAEECFRNPTSCQMVYLQVTIDVSTKGEVTFGGMMGFIVEFVSNLWEELEEWLSGGGDGGDDGDGGTDGGGSDGSGTTT